MKKGEAGETYNVGGENEWENIKLVNALCENMAKSMSKDTDYYKRLIAFVKERKGSLVAPKSVEFWDEIPLTNLGKLDKKEIRKRFWKDKDRMVS